MIFYISLGLRQVNLSASEDQILSIGFANIHFGTYVEDVGKEWIFSLTTPTKSADKLEHGFGVPLWVLLLSEVKPMFSADWSYRARNRSRAGQKCPSISADDPS